MLIFLFSLSWPQEGKSVVQFPLLETEAQKIEFLLSLKISQIFLKAAKADIDLFLLLESQIDLNQKLQQIEGYNELFQEKKFFEIRIAPTQESQLFHSQIHSNDSPFEIFVLLEIPPVLGVFRAYIGEFFSKSEAYFSYANDPHERTFFIKNLSNDIKGYLGATEVLKDGEKCLYVHSISGTQISSKEIESILIGLNKEKHQLGVKNILLPVLEKGFFNRTQAIREVEEFYLKNKDYVLIEYQDFLIRQTIQTHNTFAYNNSVFYRQEENKKAVVFSTEERGVLSLAKVQKQSFPEFEPAKESDVDELLELIVKLKQQKNRYFLKKILYFLDFKKLISKKSVFDFLNLTKECKNSNNMQLTFLDYKKTIKSFFYDKEKFSKNEKNILFPGIIYCVDSFSDELIEETSKYYSDYIRKNNDHKLLGLFYKNHSRLLETFSFKVLVQEKIRDLSSPNSSVRKSAIDILRIIRSDDPFVHRVIAKSLKDSDDLVSENAALALAETSVRDLVVLRALEQAVVGNLGDNFSRLSFLAATAFEKASQPKDLETSIEVMKALQNPDPNTRSGAALVLGALQVPSSDVFDLLMQTALKDPEIMVRVSAIRGLGVFRSKDLEVQNFFFKSFAGFRACCSSRNGFSFIESSI